MKHPSRILFHFIGLLVLLVSFSLHSGQAAGRNEVNVYLPLVENSQVSIFGRFTINGAPAEGIYNIQLQLREPGQSTQVLDSTTSAQDGTYAFLNIPSLMGNQTYKVVQYVNAYTPGQLNSWVSRTISTYTAGETVDLGMADLADVELLAPANNATVPLPTTFQWVPRPATLTDSYRFEVADANIGDPYFDSPLLGYTDHYSLNSLPAGFNPDHLFYWRVYVYAPDGSFGQCGFSNFLHFSTTNQQ